MLLKFIYLLLGCSFFFFLLHYISLFSLPLPPFPFFIVVYLLLLNVHFYERMDLICLHWHISIAWKGKNRNFIVRKYDGYHLSRGIKVILIPNGTNQHYAALRGYTEETKIRFTKESNHEETSDKPKSYKTSIHNTQRLWNKTKKI